ncbi:MAG TPA: sulfotransferase, partial [Gemmataceae bacterium]
MTTALIATPVRRAERRAPRRREWSPHFWIGCDAFAWAKLLVRNRFAVHWSKWYVAAAVSVVSVMHTALRLVQSAVYGRRIAATPPARGPVFIVGHWRSGTTLLHELLIRDPRHACPTTYECFAPHHFLISSCWLPKLLWWLMPSRRPMDNMAAGWDRPQEDEFALVMLGQPSPYRRIAFPNHPQDDGSLDLRGLTPRALRQWKAAFVRFLREVTVVNRGRRLILKSPPHTCRIPTLLELFPDARFVHIVRDPYVIYPSTLNLWRALYRDHGLQRPTFAGLGEDVLDTFVEMYDRLDEGRRLIPPGRFHELRYEDLLADPVGQLEAVYRELHLGDFEPAREHVEAYLAGVRN